MSKKLLEQINAVLNENFPLIAITDKDVKKVKGMTSNNNHQEAYLYIAKNIMNDKKFTKIFQDLVVARDKAGSMDSGMISTSRATYKDMFAKLKNRTSEVDYKKIYMST